MSAPGIGDILTSILNAVTTILAEVASAIAENAATIAKVLVLGFLVYAVWRFGSRMFRGVSGWLRGIF